MGHAHHWSILKTMPKATWQHEFEPVARHLLFEAAAQDIQLAADREGNGPPELNSNTFSFNGQGDGGCESFTLWRIKKNDTERDSCKTGGKFYDVVVLATLLFTAGQFPRYLKIERTDMNAGSLVGAVTFLKDALTRCMDVDDADAIAAKCCKLATALLEA